MILSEVYLNNFDGFKIKTIPSAFTYSTLESGNEPLKHLVV